MSYIYLFLYLCTLYIHFLRHLHIRTYTYKNSHFRSNRTAKTNTYMQKTHILIALCSIYSANYMTIHSSPSLIFVGLTSYKFVWATSIMRVVSRLVQCWEVANLRMYVHRMWTPSLKRYAQVLQARRNWRWWFLRVIFLCRYCCAKGSVWRGKCKCDDSLRVPSHLRHTHPIQNCTNNATW